jgi:valyl-tRNA synthetase
LVDGWTSSETEPGRAELEAMAWFDARFNDALAEIDRCFEEYRLADALMAVYKLVWDDFCSWYLEAVKPGFGLGASSAVAERSREFFERLLRLMHPFMPFITEELWQRLEERNPGQSISRGEWPEAKPFDRETLDRFETSRAIAVAVRALRNEKNLSPKEPLRLLHSPGAEFDRGLVCKMANVLEPEAVAQAPEQSSSFRVGQAEFYIPLEGLIDPEEEIKKLSAEKTYLEGFRKSVLAKLGNERFVAGAPADVVEREKDKLADAEAKIKAIDVLIASLKS